MLSPAEREEVADLAAQHYAHAQERASYHYFPGDRGMPYSVANEALLEAAVKWVSCGMIGNFRGFLSTIVGRRIIDAYRREMVYGTGRAYVREAPLSLDALMRPSDPGDTFGDVLTPVEDHAPTAIARVDNAALVLSDCERELIVYRYEGYRLREIGEYWGVTESRVSQIMSDLRTKLRLVWPNVEEGSVYSAAGKYALPDVPNALTASNGRTWSWSADTN